MMRWFRAFILAGGCIPSLAAAQTASPSPAERQPAGLEDIVVTAQRREERLQDVAVWVRVITSAAVLRAQITDVVGIQRAAPNVNIKPFVGDPTDVHVAMRGVSFSDSNAAVDQPVGLYVDGVYVARGPGANFGMIDVERVEVLRGPQGTLFGRNTIGGAISITSRQPKDEFGGYVQGGAGNYDAYTLTGVVNLPVVKDKIALRFVGHHNERDGYARSAIDGRQLGSENVDFFRGSAKLNPSEDWEIVLQGDYTSSHSSPAWTTLVDPSALADAFEGIGSGGTQTAYQFIDPTTRRPAVRSQGGVSSESWGLVGTVTGQIGDSGTVKSITAYRSVARAIDNSDIDGTPFTIGTINWSRVTLTQFSQELQFYGKAMDDRLDWITGAYFFTESGKDGSRGFFLYPFFVPTQQLQQGDVKNENYSLFSQLSYAITDKVRLTAGLRYSHDSRAATLHTTNLTGDVQFVSCALAGASPPDCATPLPVKNYSYIPWTVGIDFKPRQDLLFYAKFSRGFRSGGFNLRASTPDLLIPFNPEKMEAYEAGMKGEFFDRHLRVNANFYYQDYSSIQLLRNMASPEGVASAIVQNVGKGRIYGVEGEVTASLGRLTLSGNFGTADSKYTSIEPGVAFRVGESFPESPKFTGYVAADYTVPA